VKFNFLVTTAPETPFSGEDRRGPWSRRHQQPAAAAAAAEVDPRWTDARNAVPSAVGEGGDAIEELRRQGIEVDDDNEPAPENAEAPAPVANGRWEKPTMCPRRMENIPNYKGKFNSHSWEDIAEMNELDQFRMRFPEQFVIDVIIPETNKHLVGTPVTLPEFMSGLGASFTWRVSKASAIATNGGHLHLSTSSRGLHFD
jgi:hypothetical protein